MHRVVRTGCSRKFGVLRYSTFNVGRYLVDFWSIFALVDFSIGTLLGFFRAEISKTMISTLRGLRECILIPKTFSKVLQKFWGSQSNPSSNTELFGRFFKCWSIFQKSTNSQKTKIDQKSTNSLYFFGVHF